MLTMCQAQCWGLFSFLQSDYSFFIFVSHSILLWSYWSLSKYLPHGIGMSSGEISGCLESKRLYVTFLCSGI